MILNPGQLALLRDDHPHVARSYISVMIPAQVYCGRISAAPSRGDSTITVANESGNIANVIEGQQVLVSTLACGGREKSVRRLRSRNGQVLLLDANGVDWALNDYITVMENWEPRQKFPDILETSPYTIYKDEDVVYSDANLEPFPVAIMGPPWAGYMDGNVVTIQLDGSDSYAIAPGASITTWLWQSTGGVINNANVATTYITFTRGVDPPKGHEPYWIYLTVTDDNGKTQVRRNPVWIHERSGALAPYSGFSANVRLSHDAGAIMTVQALDDADTWPLGTMVVLWMEEQFDTAPNSIGGYADREHIKFVGYLVDTDSISIDPEHVGELSLTAVSVDQLLSKMKMWSIAVLDVTRNPISWYEYKNLTIARAIHHLWRWHSTLFSVADVWLPISNTLRRNTCEFPEGDILHQAKRLAFDKGIFALIGCNKQGVVYVEVDPNMIAEADRGAIDTVQEITREDWTTAVQIIARERNDLSWAALSGIFWDGVAGIPYASIMPGVVPDLDGSKTSDDQFLMLEDQADCNEKVGLAYAKANNNIKEIRLRRFAGDYTHLDVYPQEFYEITVPAADNKRGISISARRLIPRSVDILIDPTLGWPQVGAIFEPETVDVVDGIPVDYPNVPTDPPEPPPPITPEPETEAAALVAFTLGDGVYLSKDAGVNWITRNGDRAGADLDDRSGFWDPWGPSRAKHASYDPERAILWSCGVGYIMRSLDAGRHWYDVTPATDPPNEWNDSPAPTLSDLTYEMGVSDWHNNKKHYVIAWYQNASSEYRGYLLHTDDDGASWTWYAMGSNNLSAATWGYGDSVIAPTNAWLWCDVGDFGSPSRLLVTPNNILAANGAGGGMRIDYIARGDNLALTSRGLIIDFGTWFRFDNATLDGGINAEARLLGVADTMTITDPTVVDIDIDFHNLHWVNCSTSYFNQPIWDGSVAAYPPATPGIKTAALNSGQWVRYAFLDLRATAAARYRGTGYYQHLFDYVRVYPHVVQHEIRPTSIDIDRETGRFLYVSTWEGARLRVRIYDINNSLQHPVCIVRIAGYEEVSRADLDGRSKWIAVKSLYDPAWADYGTRFAYYGLWRRNAANYDNIREGYVSNDKFFAGGTLLDDASWLSTEWLGGLIWVSQDHLVAILNRGANDPELWETDDHAANWNNRSTIPYTSGAGKGVEFAIDMHGGATRVIAAGDRNGEEIFKQASPYTGAWTDITPAGAAATRVGAVRWVYNRIP